MKLSIITPTIGRALCLRRMIESVVHQLDSEDEIIVVGDGKQPGAKDVIDSFSDRRIRFYETAATRWYGNHQRNIGMDNAKGDYLAFLDDDDVYMPHALEAIREAVKRNPGLPLMFKMDRVGINVLWHHQGLEWGNIGTPMFVAPNITEKLCRWGEGVDVPDYDRNSQQWKDWMGLPESTGSDFAFISGTIRKWPEGSLVWRPEVIVRIHQYSFGCEEVECAKCGEVYLSRWGALHHWDRENHPPGLGKAKKSYAESKVKPAIDKKKALELFGLIEGFMSPGEAELLYESAIKALASGASKNIVEIGSYHGKSTVILASAASHFEGARVYAVDPHAGDMMQPGEVIERKTPTYDRFIENIRKSGLADIVVPIKKRSCDVEWHAPIGFLFIDGFHDHKNVSGDYDHYRRHVEPGGTVAFHDYHDGFRAVDEFVDGITETELERCAVGGFLVVCRMKAVLPRFGFPLIITSYISPEPRAAELAESLGRNLVNPFIDTVHILIEEPTDVYNKELIEGPIKSMAEHLLHPKVKTVPFGRRAYYRDLFDYANSAFPGRPVLVSNADIWFDTSLGRLKDVHLDGRFLVVTRGDMAHMPAHSQDTWIFKSPLPSFPCDWFMGPRGSENKVACEAAKAGLEVSNPFPDIRTHHIHATNYRVGPTTEQLPGPYHYVHPSPLSRLRTPRA